MFAERAENPFSKAGPAPLVDLFYIHGRVSCPCPVVVSCLAVSSCRVPIRWSTWT